MNTQDELRDAVDALAKPTFEHVAQKFTTNEHPDGEWRTHTVEIPSLLEQMRNQVNPSGDANGGSGAAKHTRSLGDLEAMLAYAKIDAQIRNWCRVIRITPARVAETDLLAWYQRARPLLDDDQARWYRQTMQGWVNLIRNHLDRPERFTAPHPCPICKTTAWGDAIDGGDRFPIEVRYRLDDDERMVDEVATCRIPVCAAKWYGHDAVVELAEEMNEKQGAA